MVSSVHRDPGFERPTIETVPCPGGCGSAYPRRLLSSPIRCGRCLTEFDHRGITRAAPISPPLPPQQAATVEPEPVAEPSKSKRKYRVGRKTATTSLRLDVDALAAWKVAAESAGLSLSGWLSRIAAEEIALRDASRRHPERFSRDQAAGG